MPRNGNNNRRSLGDNQPESVAPEVTARLIDDYAAMVLTADEQLRQVDQMPPRVDNEDDLQTVSKLIVDLRDTSKRAVAAHDAEKEPYLRSGQAVDGFFFGIRDRIAKVLPLLNEKVNAYQLAKAARERARRLREQQEAQRRENEARLEAEQRAREAELAERRAERAKRNQEERREEAIDANADADKAAAEAMVAKDQADAAKLRAAQPSSELARSRFDNGRLATLRRVPYAEIIDPNALDAAVLWPFVSEEAKGIALRAWARTTGHQRQMPGARVGFRDDSLVR